MLISSSVNAQLVSGDLLDEKRPLITETNFKIADQSEGVVYLQIAVDRNGDVTSAQVVTKGTTVNSTPSRIKAVNFAKQLEFQDGTYYPKFHHALIRIELYKEN